MEAKELHASLSARLTAQGHLISFALANAMRGKVDAKDTMKEMRLAFIQEWMDLLSSSMPETAERNTLIAIYAEEISKVMGLAESMVSRMKGD